MSLRKRLGLVAGLPPVLDPKRVGHQLFLGQGISVHAADVRALTTGAAERMTKDEWAPAEMRQLAADLRRFTEAVRGDGCSRIKRLASQLDYEAAEMEASKAGLLPAVQARDD